MDLITTYENLSLCKTLGLQIKETEDYLFSSCQMLSCNNTDDNNISLWVVTTPREVCYPWVDVCWGVVSKIISETATFLRSKLKATTAIQIQFSEV